MGNNEYTREASPMGLFYRGDLDRRPDFHIRWYQRGVKKYPEVRDDINSQERHFHCGGMRKYEARQVHAHFYHSQRVRLCVRRQIFRLRKNIFNSKP